MSGPTNPFLQLETPKFFLFIPFFKSPPPGEEQRPSIPTALGTLLPTPGGKKSFEILDRCLEPFLGRVGGKDSCVGGGDISQASLDVFVQGKGKRFFVYTCRRKSKIRNPKSIRCRRKKQETRKILPGSTNVPPFHSTKKKKKTETFSKFRGREKRKKNIF